MAQRQIPEQLDQMVFEHMKALYCLGQSIVPQGEDGVLFCLFYARRSMLPGEIMARMGLTTGRVANILRRLEEKGLILRNQDGEDRRRVHVSLTDAGMSLARTQHDDFIQRNTALLEYLGEENGREGLRLIDLCLDYFNKLKDSEG